MRGKPSVRGTTDDISNEAWTAEASLFESAIDGFLVHQVKSLQWISGAGYYEQEDLWFTRSNTRNHNSPI